jgi:putative PIN family toxin of toxin-antitoxin system
MNQKFVFDTNTLISASLFKQSMPRQALDKALTLGTLLLSENIIYELKNVFCRPKFDKYLSPDLREIFLQDILDIAETVEITQSFHLCRDPKDDKFLDLIVNGRANYLITGDKDLLSLNPFKTIPIIPPAEFMNLPFD